MTTALNDLDSFLGLKRKEKPDKNTESKKYKASGTNACKWCKRDGCKRLKKFKGEYFCCQCYEGRTEAHLYKIKCTDCCGKPELCEKCKAGQHCKYCDAENFKCTNCDTLTCKRLNWDFGLGGKDGLYCCNCSDCSCMSKGEMQMEERCESCQKRAKEGEPQEVEEPTKYVIVGTDIVGIWSKLAIVDSKDQADVIVEMLEAEHAAMISSHVAYMNEKAGKFKSHPINKQYLADYKTEGYTVACPHCHALDCGVKESDFFEAVDVLPTTTEQYIAKRAKLIKCNGTRRSIPITEHKYVITMDIEDVCHYLRVVDTAKQAKKIVRIMDNEEVTMKKCGIKFRNKISAEFDYCEATEFLESGECLDEWTNACCHCYALDQGVNEEKFFKVAAKMYDVTTEEYKAKRNKLFTCE